MADEQRQLRVAVAERIGCGIDRRLRQLSTRRRRVLAEHLGQRAAGLGNPHRPPTPGRGSRELRARRVAAAHRHRISAGAFAGAPAFAFRRCGETAEIVEGREATIGKQGADERRAPVLARARTTLQAAGFREQLEQLAGALAELEPRDRRPVYEITRWIAANWIGQHGPSHRSLVVEASPSDSRLRMLVYSNPELDDPQFWEQLVEGAPAELIDSWTPAELITSWEHDRRGSSGIWFDLVRPTP